MRWGRMRTVLASLRSRPAGLRAVGILLLAVAVLTTTGGALSSVSGQLCGQWVNVQVQPPNPTSNDYITLILSGTWCDSCIPRWPMAVVAGNTIMVYTWNKDPACFEVITPWQLTVPVGKLSPGVYSVIVIHNGRPIGGLEQFVVRGAAPDFIIEAIHWSPVSPRVGDPYVYFEVMIVNVGNESANLAGVELDLYKIRAGQAILVGRASWAAGSLGPGQTIIQNLTTFQYSQLTWESGTFPVRACMDASNVVNEADEANNCIERPIDIGGSAAALFVTAGCITLPPYSLLDVPIAYQVNDPLGNPIETGTKKTPFTLAYPKGFKAILDAPDSHDLHRLRQWKVSGAVPYFRPDPLSLVLDPTITEAEAQFEVTPERKCDECYHGTVGAGDACGNGVGYSIPGPSGGDEHCVATDCCSRYQQSHVHDLGEIVENCHLVVEFTPGLADGCQGILTVEISPDGQSWAPVYTSPTTSVDLDPPNRLWGKYVQCIEIPRMTPYRYVRVTISNCYNDYSAVHTCCD